MGREGRRRRYRRNYIPLYETSGEGERCRTHFLWGRSQGNIIEFDKKTPGFLGQSKPAFSSIYVSYNVVLML
jgi:hypothetical protein